MSSKSRRITDPLTEPAVLKRLSRLRRRMVSFAVRLCSIPTVNPPGDCYGQCVELLAEKLDAMGLATRVVGPPRSQQLELLPGSEDYPRPSVVARWDVGAARTLHLTGHYDVVPATAGWKTDPFKPVISGSRIIGRGTDDMKCADSAAIFAVQAMREAGATPPCNIELSFTPDEETGGALGLGWLVNSGQIKPDAAVLLEGGSGRNIGYAHKGVLWLNVTVLGKPAHACTPHLGVNALEQAGELIRELDSLRRAYASRSTAFMTNKPGHKRPTLMIGGVCGGGGKVNTVPDRFSFSIDRRLNPEEKLARAKGEILDAIRAAQRRSRRLKTHVEQMLHVPPGWIDLADPLCRSARRAYRAVTGRVPRFRMTPGFTDMHWLTQDGGVPTVMYGTSGGGAHADLEYAEIPSMSQAARFYIELAMRVGRS